MKFLRDMHDLVAPHFEKGGKLEKLYPLWEAHDTAMFTPSDVTKTGSHVRDGLDLKRLMITVVVALVPCILFAIYNTGYQAQLAITHGAVPLDDWRMSLYQAVGWASTPPTCCTASSTARSTSCPCWWRYSPSAPWSRSAAPSSAATRSTRASS